MDVPRERPLLAACSSVCRKVQGPRQKPFNSAGRRVIVVAATVVGLSAFFFVGGDVQAVTLTGQELQTGVPRGPWPVPVSQARARGGTLSVIGVPAGSPSPANTQGDGWYGLSSVDQRGRLHHLVRCPNEARWCGEVESLAWSANGRWLAVSVTSYAASNPYNGINVIDLKRGTDTLIRRCAPPECDWFDLHWSGDGSRLSYVSGGRIYLIQRTGVGGPTILQTGLPGSLSSPSWSPDGTRIVFAARSSRKAQSLLYSIRPDGTDRRLLAEDASEPAWSPDGTKIAFTSSCGNAIKLVTPNGVDVTPGRGPCRTIGVPGTPAWSPNGAQLAIAATRGNSIYRRPGVYLTDSDGDHLRLHTEANPRGITGRPGLSWQPRFSP